MSRMKIFVISLFLIAVIAKSVSGDCSSDEFYCVANDECIDNDWLCDDFPDCDDGADETDALCKSDGESSDSNADNPTAPDDSSGIDSSGGDTDVDSSESGSDKPTAVETPETCSIKVCPDSGKFKYSSGRYYKYKYNVVGISKVIGTDNKESKFNISTEVELRVLTACELELTLDEVKVVASASNGLEKAVEDEKFVKDLTSNTLRFSISDGSVETVCPKASETLEALNFKRGLISLLQNTMPRFDLSHSARENDVMGDCDFKYSFAGNKDEEFFVKKIRDMNSCSSPPLLSSSFKSVPYVFIDGIKQHPVMESKSECIQGISKERINSVSCNETHKMVPFSRGDGGITISTSQKLNLMHSSYFNPRLGEIQRRTGLSYEYVRGNDLVQKLNTTLETDANIDENSEIYYQQVQQKCEHVMNRLKERSTGVASPEEFSSLVTIFRKLNLEQLKNLDTSINDPTFREVFNGIISAVGTSSSVEFIANTLSQNADHKWSNDWLLSLSYISRPDADTLDKASVLLSSSSVHHGQAFLSFGSLIRAYCENHGGGGCRQHENVKRAMDVLQNYLNNSCQKSSSSEKIQTLMAIKGIGNAGIAASSTTSSLLASCFNNFKNENEIRVGAINAFRMFSCNLTESLKNVMSDVNEDSELRISAYLGMMRCADYDTKAFVENILKNEEINQVGSFIWTHITNLQQSGLPSKISLQSLLSSVELKEKFNTDMRKFSRNYEWSSFYDPLNIGAGIEGNLIFSQRSYIPRSASLNLTTDLFGHSFNWLEFEARVEGLERPLETILMKGMMSPVPPNEGIKDQRIRDLIEGSQSSESYSNKESEISLGLKTFGNDVYYRHLHGMEPIVETLRSFDPRNIINELNSGETLSIQKSSRIVESQGTVVTSAGLPLTVAVEGTVSLDVSAKGNLQFGIFDSGYFNPRIDIRGSLMPHVQGDIKASMTLNGLVTSAGVEVEGSLTSSSTVEGRMTGSGLSTFSLDISLPSDQMEIVNITSQVVLLHGGYEDDLSSPNEKSSDREILEAIDPTHFALTTNDCTYYADELGAQLCWSALFPNSTASPNTPKYPLSGSGHFKIILHKRDPDLRVYQLRYNLVRQQDMSALELSANTPGTSRDREHSMYLSVDSRLKTANFKFHQPQSEFDAKGRYIWTREEKSMDIVCQINGTEIAVIELGIRSHSKSSKSNYKPTAKIEWRGVDFFVLSGDITADGREDSMTHQLDLEFTLSPGQMGSEIGITESDTVTGKVSGSIYVQNDKRNMDIQIVYNINNEDHNIDISYSIQDVIKDFDWKYVTGLKVVFTQFTSLNLVWNNVYRLKHGAIETNINLNFGENYLDPDNAVHFHRTLMGEMNGGTIFLNSNVAIKHNLRNIDIKLGADFYTDQKRMVDAGFIFQLVKDREISSRLKFERDPNPMLNAKGSFVLKVPTWPDIALTGNIKETSRLHYELDFKGTAGSNYFIAVQGSYATRPLLLVHSLLLDVTLPESGVTRVAVNASAELDLSNASISVKVVPRSGHVYMGIVTYTEDVDHMDLKSRTIDIEIQIPDKEIQWTVSMAVGNVITITNKIRVDRAHHIEVRTFLDVLKDTQRGMDMILQWDPNRNPWKKLHMSVLQRWDDPEESTLRVQAYLGLLSYTYKMMWDSRLFKSYENKTLLWEHSHKGALMIWEDHDKNQKQEITASSGFSLTRGATANFMVNIDLLTPFDEWRDNHFRFNYTRDSDNILGNLDTRWHENDFLEADFATTKSFEGIGSFGVSSKLDVKSSFEGMRTLRTGVELKRETGIFVTSGSIKWEDDKVDLRFEGHDTSTEGHLELTTYAEAVTSLDGYNSLSGMATLSASSTNLESKAAAHWDSLNYEVRVKGNRYTGDDYLNGEVSLLLPGYDSGHFSGQLRIYDEENKHKLLTVAKWHGKTLKVEGEVTSDRQDFHGRLAIDTPFESYPHASLVLGKGFDGLNHKSEAKLRWGNTFNVGFELKSHINSLKDFLVSASIHTPFQNFREVKGELLNLFETDTNVKAHSRIFAQIGDKKYGIGGRYEQGSQPRIRMAFEVYTPLSGLELLSLDLRDSSLNRNSEYELLVKYGYNSPLHLGVVVIRGTNEEDWEIVTKLPFSLVDNKLTDVDIDIKTGLGWGQTPRFTFTGEMNTGKIRKFHLHSYFPQFSPWILEASLGGIFSEFPGYEHISLKSTFQLPNYDKQGHLEATFRTQGAGVSTITARSSEGSFKKVEASFTSPFEPFRTGKVEWSIVPLDVVKEKISASVSWETGDIGMTGTLYTRNNLIYRTEAVVTTPWEGIRSANLLLDSIAQSEGQYETHLTLTGETVSYDVTLNSMKTSRNAQKINVKINSSEASGIKKYYTGEFTWKFDRDQYLLEARTTAPQRGYESLIAKFDLQKQGSTYQSTFLWSLPISGGQLSMSAERDVRSRSIQYSATLKLDNPNLDAPGQEYVLNINLDNRSTEDKVDLDIEIELTSNLDEWDRIKVEGTVVQVTSEPGQVKLLLTWPNLPPLVFEGKILHTRDSVLTQPSVTLGVGDMQYKVEGELRRPDDSRLQLSGTASYLADRESLPIEVKVDSDFTFPGSRVDGTVAVTLPLAPPWTNNTLTVVYERTNGDHKFNVVILNGGHESIVEGDFRSLSPGQMEGTIKISSSLKWDKNPTQISFTQSLDGDKYIGNYTIEFPVRNPKSDSWSRGMVHASLVHSFLPAGHKGKLTLHPAFVKLDQIVIDYNFEFPNSEDLTIEVKISYKELPIGFKVQEVSSNNPNGEYNRRFTVEFENTLWPFGFENYKTVFPQGSKETVLTLYDIYNRDRNISITLLSAKEDTGRVFTLKGALPAGRVVSVSTGYHLSDNQLEVLFKVSWAADQEIDVTLKWEDASTDLNVRHKFEAWFKHPFRAVVMNADYHRIGATVNSDFSFNWNQLAESNDDILSGTLKIEDHSDEWMTHYLGFMKLDHPSLPQDIYTNLELRRDSSHPLIAAMYVVYSTTNSADISMLFNVTKSETEQGKHYQTKILALHPNSNLRLEGDSYTGYDEHKLYYKHQLLYSNLTGFETNNTVDGYLDFLQKEIKLNVIGVDNKELDLRLNVEKVGAGKWRTKFMNTPQKEYPLTSLIQVDPDHPMFSVNVDNVGASVDQTLYPKLNANKYLVRGGIEDMRNAVFVMSHTNENPNTPNSNDTKLEATIIRDIDFYFKLNHTKLITSKLLWRPNLKEELMNEMAALFGFSNVSPDEDYNEEGLLKQYSRILLREVFIRSKPIVTDLLDQANPISDHFKHESKLFILDLGKLYTSLNLTEEELKLKQSLQFIVSKFVQSLEETKHIKFIQNTLSSGELKNNAIYAAKNLKIWYDEFLSGSGTVFSDSLAEFKINLAEAYDYQAKRAYLKLSRTVDDFTNRVSQWLTSRWHAVYHNYKAHIITTLNDIETSLSHLVHAISNAVTNVREGVRNSSYFQFLTNLVNVIQTNLDKIFKRSLKENLKRVFNEIENFLKSALQFFLREVAPFLEDWLDALEEAWTKLERYPLIKILKLRITSVWTTIKWTIENYDYRERLINTAAFIFENGYTIATQTALDAQHTQTKEKSYFFMNVRDGKIEYRQKLPVVWRQFNENPRWHELKEWRIFNFIKSAISSEENASSSSILDVWYKYFSIQPSNPSSWLPPFSATAQVVGQQNLVSWNGKLTQFKGLCRHLLAADLVSMQWAIVLNYHANARNAYIIYVEGIKIELEENFEVKKNGRTVRLPVVLNGTVIFRNEEKVQFHTKSGLNIIWDQKHDVFTIQVSGIYFGKIVGLLGTNNYEHMDDTRAPNGYLHQDAVSLTASWSVSSGRCDSRKNFAVNARTEDSFLGDRCNKIFMERDSNFKYCYYQVPPSTYESICLSPFEEVPVEGSTLSSCTASTAYRAACAAKGVPSKIPHDCNHCTLSIRNGTEINLPESQSISLSPEQVILSTDVVLIMEAGSCNQHYNLKRNFRRFLLKFDSIMARNGLDTIRYTIVTYGGEGFYQRPRQIFMGSDVFTPINQLKNVFSEVQFETSDPPPFPVDAFEALRFASNLPFNAGITPTFLMMPCTPCNPDVGEMDFPTMYHILVDRGVVLHILTPADLLVNKERLKSKLLGIDETYVYTNKDARKEGVMGSSSLRRQVTAPRSRLEYCSPLAIQTNGTIFTSRSLFTRRRRRIDQLATVLGRRIAQTSLPSHDQTCVCLPTDGDSVKTSCYKHQDDWGTSSVVAPYFDDQQY